MSAQTETAPRRRSAAPRKAAKNYPPGSSENASQFRFVLDVIASKLLKAEPYLWEQFEASRSKGRNAAAVTALQGWMFCQQQIRTVMKQRIPVGNGREMGDE